MQTFERASLKSIYAPWQETIKKKNKINQIRQNKGNNESKSKNQSQWKQTINNINEAGSSKRSMK